MAGLNEMLFTQITIAKQLDPAGADRLARRLALAHVLTALGITAGGLGVLVMAIRWQ